MTLGIMNSQIQISYIIEIYDIYMILATIEALINTSKMMLTL